MRLTKQKATSKDKETNSDTLSQFSLWANSIPDEDNKDVEVERNVSLPIPGSGDKNCDTRACCVSYSYQQQQPSNELAEQSAKLEQFEQKLALMLDDGQ